MPQEGPGVFEAPGRPRSLRAPARSERGEAEDPEGSKEEGGEEEHEKP